MQPVRAPQLPVTSSLDKSNTQDFATCALLPQEQASFSWSSDSNRTDRIGDTPRISEVRLYFTEHQNKFHETLPLQLPPFIYA